MSSTNSTSDFVRPAFFVISGFTDVPYSSYYYTFLCCCYAVAFMGNLFLMTIIYLVNSLHTPKYMAVFTLAAADVGESSAFVTKLVETFLLNRRQIEYVPCLTHMFFIFLFFGVESFSLTLLSYDRFVAICFPLRYHSILTNTSMGKMISVCFLITAFIVASMVAAITRLSFCKSLVVTSYFCDHGPLYRLACNDYSLNRFFTWFYIIIYMFIPIILIVLSYARIVLALYKIASWEERIKATKTCFSHLFLVSVFYLPLTGIYMAQVAITIPPNVRISSASLSYAIPPVLNPIVYSLNTAEVKDFIKKLFRRNKSKVIVPAVSK